MKSVQLFSCLWFMGAASSAPGMPSEIIGPVWTADGDQSNALLGTSVSSAGDVNGDGFSDLLIGAPGYDYGKNDGGAVFVYHGSASGPSTTADWSWNADDSAELGFSVSAAGDVNGDGYDDVLVGAPNSVGNLPFDARDGMVELFLGSSSGLVFGWSARGGQAGSRFGQCVAGAGDVNRDGYDDVLIAAPLFDITYTDEGKVDLYLGSASGIPTIAWTQTGGQAGAQSGFSVDGAGDVNGDGYHDVIVGIPFWDSKEFLLDNIGQARIYHGNATGLKATPATILEDWLIAGPSSFGWSVCGAGDVNGDGYGDVLVGAPLGGTYDSGMAYLHAGGGSGIGTVAIWSERVRHDEETGLGKLTASAGDVNADGFGDFLIHKSNGSDEDYYGLLSCYLGAADPEAISIVWTEYGEELYSDYGISAGTAGDVNADGFSDIVVGAPRMQDDPDTPNEGRAYLYLGSASVEFRSFGEGLAGSNGFVPELRGESGPAFAGKHSIHISNALGGAPALFWVGVNDADYYPFFGGHFYVDFARPWTFIALRLQGPPGVPGAGFLDIPGSDKNGFAGLTLYLQCTVIDPGARRGLAITNGLELRVEK